MNKYQESLNFIVKNSCPKGVSCDECDFSRLCNSLAKGHINVLQELVDKATPKKPIVKHYEYEHKYCKFCASCGKQIRWGSKFCRSCGQAQDWGNLV